MQLYPTDMPSATDAHHRPASNDATLTLFAGLILKLVIMTFHLFGNQFKRSPQFISEESLVKFETQIKVLETKI